MTNNFGPLAVYRVMTGQSVALRAAADVRPDRAERLGALFDTHHDRLYRLARRLSHQADEARDLVQETFLKAAQSIGSVPDGQSSEEAWLVRVLVNICRDRWRRTKVRRRLDPLMHSKSAINPEPALLAYADVWRALDSLSARRRTVVILCELEGLSTTAVAGVLGVTVVTVRWHLSRARRELAAVMRGQGGRR